MTWKLTRSALLVLVLLGASMSRAQQAGALGEPIVLQTTYLPKGFLRQPYHFKLEAQGGILPSEEARDSIAVASEFESPPESLIAAFRAIVIQT